MIVSLICPLKNEAAGLERNIQDLKSFVQKFPIHLEVLLVIDPSQDETVLKARGAAAQSEEKFVVQALVNSKNLGRARSVQRGLNEATGELMIVSSFGWTIPLAEIFNALQELVTNPQTLVVLGNRNTSRKKRTAQMTPWGWGLEKMLVEKLRYKKLDLQDPTSSFLGIRKGAYELVSKTWKPRGWFYTPTLLLALQKKSVQAIEIPILSNDSKLSRLPVAKEWMRSFWL